MTVMLLTSTLVLLAVSVALIVSETFSQRRVAQGQLVTLANVIGISNGFRPALPTTSRPPNKISRCCVPSPMCCIP